MREGTEKRAGALLEERGEEVEGVRGTIIHNMIMICRNKQ